jgi:pyridoxamine 5'-phosphate oxidase family protein
MDDQEPAHPTKELTIVTFTAAEIAYLNDQPLGRLATLQPGGAPQASPVGFEYNETLSTIDISGFSMSSSQKFRNVVNDDRVAFVIDDIASKDPWRVRCLEIRGIAEAIADPDAEPGKDKSMIRVRPQRIISFGIDETDVPPHLIRPNSRNVA